MKRVICFPLILSIFLSCKSKTDDSEQGSSSRLNQSPALIQQFKPMINGVWVKKDYIKKVKKSKSPLEAVDKGRGITVLYIDTAKLTGDSIIVPVILNNHEGSNLTLKFQPGRNTTTITLGKDELSYKLKKDTNLIIYHYNPDTRETNTDQYIKAMDKQPAAGLAPGMNFMINQAILSGRYEGADASGKKITANFTNDGKVTGLAGFTTYYIQNDLITDPDHSHDEIIFNLGTTGQKAYSFIINKKTLSLYDGSEKVKSNKPAFSLKKQR
ncbi:hypothetical protein [Mucilaginibacter phyllosphaerae]|uniref:Uncharacterized protein n=1 Tax=Mucilaginibacter phyllosphaerae TaxID=1812349 RepID=A0A4Y8AFI1_9SPHI|nr:hypothetical protein [Mucilaginibacter phyllosphaerae]MBB3968868.1 hypothetical protein [Mucilaginibacter phyllosphaerae]TEW67503.1 hypothetical protein E2R65_05810 [Mucilaginibacter phyllosphaerae]GGH13428.1 hypothetical protein GCM10007352_20840 [Mucilaginibacter phyllosphaerae]